MMAFRDRPIITKMRLMTVVILILFTTALAILFGTYWLLGTRREAEISLRERTETSALSLDQLMRSVTEGVVSACGTEDFALKMTDMIDASIEPTRLRVMLQEELTRLATSSSAIESALLVDTETGTAFTLFRDSLSLPQRLELEEGTFSTITALPSRESPIRGQEQIIPVIYPLSRAYGGVMIGGRECRILMIVLVDSDSLLSLMPEGSELLAENGTGIIRNGGIPEGRNIIQCSSVLPFSGLTLTARTDMALLRIPLVGTAAASFLAAFAVILILAVAHSAVLARYVTMPIRKLKESVISIEDGDYSSRAEFQGSDELGDLRDSISAMASTIESQIESIREEQDKRTRTELHLLSEQLTPHFLYNTLECIQQEIQNGNSGEAAEMTRALSLYLRTVLSYGSETISIRNEIQHDMSYIRIMNGRFRRDISYQHTAEPGIDREPMLKMVLQPFIENSIKHGFGIGDDGTWVQAPEIRTDFLLSEGRLRIEISDNGQGFDEEAFLSIMHGVSEGEGHIGIRNTYLRLITFYGEGNVDIKVSSIPFYRSSITITVPRLSTE